MKIVHTEIYMGKTIEIYSDRTATIDGEKFKDADGRIRAYMNIGTAKMAAKAKIRKNASKADEIKKLEAEIEALQAKLKEMRG